MKKYLLFLEHYIYSAAHCFKEDLIAGAFDKNELRVVLGSSEIFKLDIISSWGEIQYIKVNTIEISSFSNDVVVLTLVTPIIYSNHIINICLKGVKNKLPSFGLVAALGTTKEEDSKYVLKQTSIKILNFDTCNTIMEQFNEPRLAENQLCGTINYDRGEVFNGILGSGLVIMENKSMKFNLIGVVSKIFTTNIVAVITKVNTLKKKKIKQKPFDVKKITKETNLIQQQNSDYSILILIMVIFLIFIVSLINCLKFHHPNNVLISGVPYKIL